MDCKHGLELTLADDSGMTCEGIKCAGGEVMAGTPLLGCRQCDKDLCAKCAGAELLWEHRAVTGWVDAHMTAMSKGKLCSIEEKDVIGWTPLHWLCWNHPESLNKLANVSIDALCEARDNLGQVPLMFLYQSSSCMQEAAEAVAAAGKLAITDELGRSLLTHLCQGEKGKEGREAVLKELVRLLVTGSHSNLLNMLDRSGYSALHYSIMNEDETAVRVLLEGGAEPTVPTGEGYSPLFLAIEGEERRLSGPNVNIIRELVKAGADVNESFQVEDNNLSSLLLCAGEGYLEVAKVLLENGADTCVKDAQGNNILHYVARGDESWTDDGEEVDTTWRKESEHLVEILRLVLESVASESDKVSLMNGTNEEGLTPLLLACERNFTQAALALLEHGKEIDVAFARAQDGVTCLHLACENGNAEVVEKLVASSAPVNQTSLVSSGGYAALHFALQNPCGETQRIISCLLQGGADVALATEQEKLTPLHLAALFCPVEVCRTLLDSGAPLDATDRDGDTPLHNAAGKQEHGEDRTEVVKLLLDRGAQLEKANRKGFTPLAAAAAAENRPVAAILVKSGAKAVTLEVNEGTNEIKVASADSSSSSSDALETTEHCGESEEGKKRKRVRGLRKSASKKQK